MHTEIVMSIAVPGYFQIHFGVTKPQLVQSSLFLFYRQERMGEERCTVSVPTL